MSAAAAAADPQINNIAKMDTSRKSVESGAKTPMQVTSRMLNSAIGGTAPAIGSFTNVVA